MRKSTIIASVVALIVGFIAGSLVPSSFTRPIIGSEEREHDENYQFINPLLSCGDADFNHLGNDESKALEKDIEGLVAKMKSEGRITDAGVYFRNINSGPWVGVNFEAEFTPGSLLKVPLAMGVYQLDESIPGFLESQIEYEGGEAPATEYFTAPVITPGVYTVRDLVRATLVNSDNNAAILLANIIGKDNLNYSYSHLGITPPVAGNDYSTSVRDYASFFRILYNATYLDRMQSEEILKVLSESVFDKALVAGLPKGTVVAHKFGERALIGEYLVQLHDCGIVYHPTEPYLICVMMRGNDFDILANAIADISTLVYDSVI
jgi:beta-lactamase class A